ncbi:BRO-N domain-containing protein [Clostridium perfringens]
MNNLVIFEGKNINMIMGENDEPLFELYGVGQALGYVTKNSAGKEYPHKVRINKTVENADIMPCVQGVHKYLNEEMIYDFMFEAKTDKCKSFRKWLSQEVLPSIRKNGAYVEETITDKQQELLIKYATPAFRKNTFLNNTPVEKI